MDTKYLAFIGVAALLTVTPGADMALVTKSSLRGGRQTARRTALGVCFGLFVWGVASAVGIAAIVATSALAFALLKTVGACYLIWLGAAALWRSRRGVQTPAVKDQKQPASNPRPFWQGLGTNVLNPKIAVFYTTLLPQFIVSGQSVLFRSLLLAATHAGLSLVWLVSYAEIVGRAQDFMRRPVVGRVLDRATGLVLVGLGVGLAFEHR
jgi:threonine/homoserine/homoserine lactone efflux protein